MFTHIQNFCKSLSHVCRTTFSQIQCFTSRLAAACCVTPGGTGTRQCTEARRPSPCCSATWMAAHARVADASKRAPPVGASHVRRQCWLRSKSPPLRKRLATRDPRRLSQSTTCAAKDGASAAVQSICSSSSKGYIGNSKRPISDSVARMAQPSASRCMPCNIRT